MTGIEGRTRKALHEVADGLLVSDDDLRRMEEDLMTLVDTPTPKQQQTPPSRRWTWAVAVAAAAALVLAGTALWRTGDDTVAPVPATTPTVDDAILFDPALVGMWRSGVDGEWLWAFTADGRVSQTNTAQGLLHGGRELASVVARDGDIYDIVRQPGNCLLRLGITVKDPDSAVARVVEDRCPEGGGGDVDLDRVSGRAAASPPLAPHFPVGVSGPAASITSLSGTWLDPASGTILALAAPSFANGDVEYLMDDDGDGVVSPDQRGTLTMAPSGAVEPVDGPATSGTCAPVFSSVATDTATMTTTAGAGGCLPEGTRTTWLSVN